MKQVFTAILILLSSYFASAQHLEFQKLYSTTGPTNQGSEIIEEANGDLIFCGVRSVPVGPGQYIANIILVKTDSNGDTLWTKELGTTTDRELSLAMVQLHDYDLVIVGSINVPPDATTMDALVIRCDVAGNVKWQKRYGGNMQDYATGIAIDGLNLIISGITYSYGSGNSDAWILKLDDNGDTVWTRTYGGVEADEAWDVAVVNGEYYVTGGTYSFSNGQYNDAWLIKLDNNGNKLWQKIYGVKDKVDLALALEPAMKNSVTDGLVFAGVTNTEETQPNNSFGDLFFVKVDTAGNVVWDKSIKGTPYRREGLDIKQLADESFVIAGFLLEPSVQSQQLYVIKTDNAGVVMWDTAYGTNDSSYIVSGIGITQDGGWAVTGAVFTPNQPIRYIFVAKFLPFGNGVVNISCNEPDIKLYPNPAHRHFTVKTGSDIEVHKIRIVNIDGRVVYKDENVADRNVDVSALPAGYYIVELDTGKGIQQQKLVID